MKLSDFPRSAGKLTRKNAVMKDSKVQSVIYGLKRNLAMNKKFSAVASTVFNVKVLNEKHFKIMIGKKTFLDAHSMEEVAARLIGALDQECIRTGIASHGGREQAPSDTSVFRNPRSS